MKEIPNRVLLSACHLVKKGVSCLYLDYLLNNVLDCYRKMTN